MSSQAQVLANRRNAGKSTGPRTREGKAVVAQNAIKHGFLAHQDLIQGEDRERFESCRRQLLGDLAPVGPMESTLAERIASLTWRLKRAERLQNEIFDYLIAREIEDSLEEYDETLSAADEQEMRSDPDTEPVFAAGRAVLRDYSNEKVLDRLMMYERRIENSLYRTMSELHKLRRMREEDGHAKERPPTTAGGSVKTEGLGDGLVATEADHRQAALDAATRSAPAETANDSAKQSQFPPMEDPHGQQVAHPTPSEPATEVPTQGGSNLPCETKPISFGQENGTMPAGT
jgi:hypothetical protein